MYAKSCDMTYEAPAYAKKRTMTTTVCLCKKLKVQSLAQRKISPYGFSLRNEGNSKLKCRLQNVQLRINFTQRPSSWEDLQASESPRLRPPDILHVIYKGSSGTHYTSSSIQRHQPQPPGGLEAYSQPHRGRQCAMEPQADLWVPESWVSFLGWQCSVNPVTTYSGWKELMPPSTPQGKAIRNSMFGPPDSALCLSPWWSLTCKLPLSKLKVFSFQ